MLLSVTLIREVKMSSKTYFNFTGTIFAVVAAFHLLRILFGWQIAVGNFSIPVSWSIIPVIVLSVLSYFAFKLGGILK